MCLAVSIVGAPIGARSKRSGKSFAFSIGLLIITGYCCLAQTGGAAYPAFPVGYDRAWTDSKFITVHHRPHHDMAVWIAYDVA